jgi:hypothetical protein
MLCVLMISSSATMQLWWRFSSFPSKIREIDPSTPITRLRPPLPTWQLSFFLYIKKQKTLKPAWGKIGRKSPRNLPSLSPLKPPAAFVLSRRSSTLHRFFLSTFSVRSSLSLSICAFLWDLLFFLVIVKDC